MLSVIVISLEGLLPFGGRMLIRPDKAWTLLLPSAKIMALLATSC